MSEIHSRGQGLDAAKALLLHKDHKALGGLLISQSLSVFPWGQWPKHWDRLVCHFYVDIYCAQEKQWVLEPNLSIFVDWEKLCHFFFFFAWVFLIYKSDLEELSHLVHPQHNIMESICCGWIGVNQFPVYCTDSKTSIIQKCCCH